jgi:kynureninase
VILCDEWTLAQVKAFRLMVNRSVNWASWDNELLALELQELSEADFDLSLTGFDPGEIDALLAIRAKSIHQTQRLIELADEAGIPVRSCRDARTRGGVIVVDVPNGEEVTRELARREVLVDYRPGAGIRIASHFYNSNDELDRAIGEIQSIVELFG